MAAAILSVTLETLWSCPAPSFKFSPNTAKRSTKSRMAEKKLDSGQIEAHDASHGSSDGVQQIEDRAVTFQQKAHQGDIHINLSWRSWVR
jgi:hypothetical protein